MQNKVRLRDLEVFFCCERLYLVAMALISEDQDMRYPEDLSFLGISFLMNRMTHATACYTALC